MTKYVRLDLVCERYREVTDDYNISNGSQVMLKK